MRFINYIDFILMKTFVGLPLQNATDANILISVQRTATRAHYIHKYVTVKKYIIYKLLT